MDAKILGFGFGSIIVCYSSCLMAVGYRADPRWQVEQTA